MPQSAQPSVKQNKSLISFLRDYFYLLVVFIFAVAVVCADPQPPAPLHENAIPVHDGWTDANGETVDLNALPYGDLLLTKDISCIQSEGHELCMISIDTVFDVYADGVLLYSYRPVLPKLLGKSYGMNVHTIPIPRRTSELKMQVEPIFADTSAATLTNVMLEDAGVYMSDTYKSNLAAFIRSTITMLIGALFLVLGIPRGVLSRTAGIDFVSFGAMCLLLGFSGLNDTYILQIITRQPAVIRVLTYVCIICVPYPALNFFASAAGNRNSRTQKVMFVLCAVNFLATVILTLLGVSDYYNMVSVSHAIFVVDFVLAIFLVVRAVKKKTIRPMLVRSLIAGLSACILGAGMDMLRYHLGWNSGFSDYSRVGVLLFMILMSIYMFREQVRSLNQKHQESVIFIKEITEAFAKVIDMKDTYTNGHSFRVAKYTEMLAKELGCDAETSEKYYRIALLHDIGKIGIPSDVLNKPGKLTDGEYRVIQSHSELGFRILKDISILPELAIGAHSHHERPDGKGYPEGLKGDEIPRVAQIIAVADCFDAMYSNRPYRNRMNFDTAVSIIRDVAGTQLSMDVVDAFQRLVEKGEFRLPSDTGGGSTENIDNTVK